MKEKNNKVKVPVDLNECEVEKLNERLELFNRDVPEESKISLEEYISLIFKINLLENELTAKKQFVRILNSEINKLEEELFNRYSNGLEGCEEAYNEIIEVRRKTLNDSSNYAKNYKNDYIDLLVNFIEVIVYSCDYDDAILTLKETFGEDIRKNPNEVIKAINIVRYNLKPSEYNFNEIYKSLIEFEKYVN